MEAQIEEDYSDKQKIMKEKRELERQIQELHDQQQERDRSMYNISEKHGVVKCKVETGWGGGGAGDVENYAPCCELVRVNS